MELAHSLLLNEEALSRIPESKRSIFIFEWLHFLDKVLVAAQKSDIKESQPKLVSQLTGLLTENIGPPTRKILARCLATIFSIGDTFALFDTLNKCNDIIKSKDESAGYLQTRLVAIACLGGMYEKLGRMVGRSYEETVQILIRALKNAESQGRSEIMLTLQKVVAGIGSAGSNCYKDIFKAARGCLTDRAMVVRSSAALLMYELVNEAPFIYTTELESTVSLCFRALDGSNYDVRCAVAKLLGHMLAMTQSPGVVHVSKVKPLKLDEALNILAGGFIRSGSGFLKTAAPGEVTKGAVNREVRVGIAHAYVEFGKEMEGLWFERNFVEFLTHVVGLVSNPRAVPSHVDAVYARRCVQFILRSLIGQLLGEKAQIVAARELCSVIEKQMNAVGVAAESEKAQTAEQSLAHHSLVCVLNELGSSVLNLGTSAAPLISEPSTGIVEPVVSVLTHPVPAARLAAAWCLRCISVSMPAQMTILIERCLHRIQHMKSSPEAITGYTYALAALLGGVRETSLGIPHAKGKQIFGLAEELLRSASQNSRLSLQRTQGGWLLLGALMTLGPAVVKGHLPRMLLLWRNAFPRSVKELESEKATGDAFTWQVCLEGRSGALATIQSFLMHCSELATEDVVRRVLPSLECALSMTTHLPAIIQMYGAHLKASAANIRLRIYDTLLLLPASKCEGMLSSLLRDLVGEFTLADNPSNTTTSLLRTMCHTDDSIILGAWLQETDQKAIEDQLQPNSASGSGALEHDPTYLYMKCPPGETSPGPLPLGVAVIDSSLLLYGHVFPRVPHKHRLQMLEHFAECIKQTKGVRQQVVQINIFTAVLCALKALAETKTGFGNIDVRKAAINLVMGALGSANPILRCAAGEALGRISQVVGESKFIAEMAQHSFDKLKSARDVITRTGHSLALGCLHRYVGGMGSGQHLNTSVSILLALAQDSTAPVVQVWALHALGLIADSGGPMFRGFVEPTLSLVLQLLLSVPQAHVDVHQCLGKCLGALLTTLGPELQSNTGAIVTARMSCVVCCAIMLDHTDSMVQAEAIACLQQQHLFAPRHVNLTLLIPHLSVALSSPHLLLRCAAVSCLRQLVQREAREVSEYALSLVSPSAGKDKYPIGKSATAASGKRSLNGSKTLNMENGIEGALFAMLDKESDKAHISNIQDTLISMLQALAASSLSRWLTMLKDLLQTPSESSQVNTPSEDADGGQKDADDYESMQVQSTDLTKAINCPRWPTRVFAIDCLLRVIVACETDKTHFDLAAARIQKQQSKADYLIFHLSEMIRIAFIAATSDSDKLRLAGLAALKEIIAKFCQVPEPEFAGHVVLEQYQAQVGAALRPAFAPETAPDVTAAACEVCSCWIGSRVARDLNDLRRVHQLLASSLAKLKDSKEATVLYSESASTMEKLAVLKAWAEVYVVAMDEEMNRAKGKAAGGSKDEDEDDVTMGGESLLTLVQPELSSLSAHWLAALRDHATLCLPSEVVGQQSVEGGVFYTVDTADLARGHYRKAWPAILYAVSMWLKQVGFTNVGKDASRPANMKADDSDVRRFHLLLGVTVEALCSPASSQPMETVILCLKSLLTLFDIQFPRRQLALDSNMAVELLAILHRVLLTRESAEVQLLALQVARVVVEAVEEHMEEQRSLKTEQAGGGTSAWNVGEGDDNGQLSPGKSVVYAAMEICFYVLVRYMPVLNPMLPSTADAMAARRRSTEDMDRQVAAAFDVMARLPFICSSKGLFTLLPTLLHLVISVFRELAPANGDKSPACLEAGENVLRAVFKMAAARGTEYRTQWLTQLQSALYTVIKQAQDSSHASPMDAKTNMRLLSLFCTSCPIDVIAPANLGGSTVEVFASNWSSNNAQTQVYCLQCLHTILQQSSPAVSHRFVKALSARVFQLVVGVVESHSELDLALTLAAIHFFELLLPLAVADMRVQLVYLNVVLLAAFVLPPASLAKASKPAQALHVHALKKITELGTVYPEDFRQVVQSSTTLRAGIEAALKAQQAVAKSQSTKSQTVKSVTKAAPTIQLRKDFSNFMK